MLFVRTIGLFSLTYVLWRPVSSNAVLFPVLTVLALTSLIGFRPPPSWFARVGLLIMTVVFLMLFVGSINGNPGVWQQFAVWVGGLLIWGLWANSFTINHIRPVLFTIMVSTTILSSVILLYVGVQTGVVPEIIPAFVLTSQGAGFNSTELGTAIRFYGLSTLAGAAPLCIGAALAGRAPSLPPAWICRTSALLALGAVAVGGRQAILGITLIAPILFAFVRHFVGNGLSSKSGNRGRLSPGWVLASPVLLLLLLQVSSTTTATSGMTAARNAAAIYLGIGQASGYDNADSAIRQLQSTELVNGWSENPFFGAGLGAGLPNGFARSDHRPWMFELQYHQLLFNGGLVAVVVLAMTLLLAIRHVTTLARAYPEHGPTTVVACLAALGMMISNVSNPYLQAPGHGWSIALVLGIGVALSRQPVAQSDSLASKEAAPPG